MNTNLESLAKLLEEARQHIAYKTEGAIIEFTEELCRIMKQTGCSKAELANRIGCRPAYITKLLSGQNNFTIETMVKVAAAVGAEVRIHLQPAGARRQQPGRSPHHLENPPSSRSAHGPARGSHASPELVDG